MSETNDAPQGEPPVAVPPGALSAEALRGVVESFVLREGTDYGERDVEFETKVARVLQQLERGDATLWFDPATETVEIAPAGKRPAGPSG